MTGVPGCWVFPSTSTTVCVLWPDPSAATPTSQPFLPGSSFHGPHDPASCHPFGAISPLQRTVARMVRRWTRSPGNSRESVFNLACWRSTIVCARACTCRTDYGKLEGEGHVASASPHHVFLWTRRHGWIPAPTWGALGMWGSGLTPRMNSVSLVPVFWCFEIWSFADPGAKAPPTSQRSLEIVNNVSLRCKPEPTLQPLSL